VTLVIKRTDQSGGYLARPGSQHSYTRKLEHAQTFPTREAAQAQCCENERPVDPFDQGEA
jgi:hypothetical protein